MRRDTHIWLEVELSKQIEQIASRENVKMSDVINRLLSDGLKYDSVMKKLDNIINLLNNINSKSNYSQSLLQQIYSDLNLNQRDPKTSVNLKIFNESYRKRNKKLID